MVRDQIEGRGIINQKVLEAMRNVPRHLFVPKDYQGNAYEDRPIMIGENQTISQPYMVALMTQLLNVQLGERVLEIGTGSGYQAAVLAMLAEHVYTIELHSSLAKRAQWVLDGLGITNVTILHGDGSLGWAEHAPYDGIIITAAAPDVPQPLLEQMKEGGRLVVPVGGTGIQYLQLWQKKLGKYSHEVIVPVSFVPLRGEHGWTEDKFRRL